MTIFAGRLDTRVKFRTVTVTDDGMGGTSEAWADISNSPTRAEYMPLRGQEKLMAGQLADVTEFKLRVRRDANLSKGDRVILDEGATCEILDIEDNRRRGRDMVLHCREVAP